MDAATIQFMGILTSLLWVLHRLLMLFIRELRGGSPELQILKQQLQAANSEHQLLLERILSRLDDAVEAARR